MIMIIIIIKGPVVELFLYAWPAGGSVSSALSSMLFYCD